VSDEIPQLKATYRLKAMVLARIFSEATVLAVLIFLPLILFLLGKLALLPVGPRAVVFAMAVLSLMVLPFYGFIVWQVKTDESGITTFAVFKKQFCQWTAIRALSRRSSWNWPRYVVEFAGGELTFPVLLYNGDNLLQIIRAHLPAGAVTRNPFRRFNYDPVALGVQIAQAVAGCVFILIFWFFYARSMQEGIRNPGDAALLLGFCIVFTVILLWRTVVVFLIPRAVEITREDLIIRTLFFQRRIPWLEVVKVKPPFPLLPEGFMIRTRRWSYLVGSGMDSSDELHEVIKTKIEHQRVN
jgi:hypothetical protein